MAEHDRDTAPNTAQDTAQAAGDHPGVIVKPPLLYIATLFIGLLADQIWPLGFIDLATTPRLLLGAGILVAGGALLAWATGRFAKAGTNVPTDLPATILVTDGPYRLSRNPIYVALTLIYIGLAASAASAWGLVLLVPLLITMRYGVIAREEAYLAKKFGDTYLTYKTSVRRWL